MSLNPNDPVIQALKSVTTQYEAKLADLGSALEEMAKGHAGVIEHLLIRIAGLEKQVMSILRPDLIAAKIPASVPSELSPELGGKEL